ncbi:GNAT family N-acetyltransferase [Halobaculum limi]|uniref:GNAT family N-acetyltransferase n=1 Tax=Halobaculum limi TaxID=3031916 RepID=UPI0024053489|nr:GNAT family N-acetyltransferase [Halobaculum sp. YSMS11]
MTTDQGNTDGQEHASDRVVVEPGRIEDAETVAGLWVDLARDQRAYGSHLLPEENRQAAVDSIARAVVSRGLFVAIDCTDEVSPEDGDIVGFVSFGQDSGRYEQNVTTGTIYNLYVRPGYRDEGIGARLLTHAEAAFAESGVDVVCLEAMAGNVGARRFYERHGYDQHRVELEKLLTDDPKR